MNILIVSATGLEIKPLLDHMKIRCENSVVRNQFNCRHLKSNINFLITGVGLMHAAYWLGKTVSTSQYDLAFNLGICGSFTKNLLLGEVVNVARDQIGDMGAEDGQNFLDLVDLGLSEERSPLYKKGRLINGSKAPARTIELLRTVSGISVNKTHGNKESINKILKKYDVETESMEGAAFLFACMMAKLPCFQIRAISNYVEQRDVSRWNIPLAINNLNEKFIEILDSI